MKKLLTSERKKQLISFSKKAQISFSDLELLNHAFYHRSAANELFHEKKDLSYNNERLEFLGDSVLGMVTAAYLFENLENSVEGELAKIKSAVVSEKTLAKIAVTLGVDKLLILGHGEEITGGRKKAAILADCMEAIIGAYYIDSGYKAAQSYVLSFIVPEIKNVLKSGTKDFKTQLQEFVQKEFKICPIYKVVGTEGPEHEKSFLVMVKVGEKLFGPCKGSNKKNAEQNVAEQALKSLKK